MKIGSRLIRRDLDVLSDIEQVVKSVYGITCGERVSWEGVYGKNRPEECIVGTRRIEDIAEDVQGLKFV